MNIFYKTYQDSSLYMDECIFVIYYHDGKIMRNKMSRACSKREKQRCLDGREMRTNVSQENLTEGDQFEDLGIDGI
jgi:hypothetical protein